MQTITPYLLYEDGDAAIQFLVQAFGFEEKFRAKAPDGRTAHAELALGDGMIHLGQPGSDYRGPRKLGTNTCLLYVYVDDVDSHCERARTAGAEIADEPADQEYGDRRYHVRDPEGHDWYFAQRLNQAAGPKSEAEVTTSA